MKKYGLRLAVCLALIVALVSVWGTSQAYAKSTTKPAKTMKFKGRITPAERKAAANRSTALGVKPGVAGKAVASGPISGAPSLATIPTGIEGPGGVPHYFGPYGNWAYTPLPMGAVTTITVDQPGSGYTAPVVTITDAYGTATAPATATAALDSLGGIASVTLTSGGANYSAPVVTIQDPTGADAIVSAYIGGALTGGIRKFVDGMPGLTPAGANQLDQDPNTAGIQGQYIPVAQKETRTFSGQAADYYEIAIVEYYEKMHSDLPATRLRGYVQLSTPAVPGARVPLKYLDGSPIYFPGTTNQVYAVDRPHYLGPLILAQGSLQGTPAVSAVPVRIKFYNFLPTGSGGDLFLPVDETVMGSGYGPSLPGQPAAKYTQNRATIHLHGNNTVWISDGNTHQWFTPASESTPYPKGVSARNVPDMGTGCDAPGSGCMTFYYTNAQSARLMFYHDHASGITRLNVYAGEAAGYLITDAVEQDMIQGTNVTGVNPTNLKVLPDLGIPLVIQDKTFVDASTIWAQDPTWNWGTGPRTNGKITAAVTGDLWYPHVYMSAQNPWDLTGTNAFGRWHYGPWFNPPTPECVNGLPVGCIEVGPVPNEYYQPICDTNPADPACTAPWEPPFRPGSPNPSIPGEGFMDTPLVNGTAYPYLTVEPKAYRFRILNAANDRMFNLQLYVAADKTTPTTAPTYVPGVTRTNVCDKPPASGGVAYANCTEVNMAPVYVLPANQYGDWPSGIPDPAFKGPAWIQIGTEGGFMAKPVVVPQQPVGWNLNPTTFNFGNVNQHSLLVGSAERADVIVDFTAYAGKTLILYNDAPAAFPAGVPVYDYFTGVANQMDMGGAPSTQPGYGPNTRTIMQIRVGTTVTTPTPDVTLANLNSVFAKTATKRGVFERSQETIIVPQAAYNTAYNATFPSTAAGQYLQIADTAKTFKPIDPATGQLTANSVTLNLEQKAMHDEMGGVYDTQFGRMSGMLGLTNPTSPVHVLIPYGYSSPPTDLVMGSVEGTPVGVLPDGTQIWRIFHNGVDTHTIHTHLFHAQLVNRIAQDGIMLPFDPIELGWKDTFRVNPLEITYLAMRPTIPLPTQVPFDVPNSIRLIDPTLPEGAPLPPPPPAGWFDPAGTAITEILNHYVNLGWEYVWHCHILAHEEMDMMHSLAFAVPPKSPSGLTATGTTTATLNWTDNSNNETNFKIQRAGDSAFTTGLTTFIAGENVTTFVDNTIQPNTPYYYRVSATNLIGDTQAYPNSIGFPNLAADSGFSNTAQLGNTTPPAAPTSLTATLQTGPQVRLGWTDNATNETGFVIERCVGVNCASVPANFVQIAAPGPRTLTGGMTYFDTNVLPATSYSYRVKAMIGTTSSAYTNVATVNLPALPAPATTFTAKVTKITGSTNYTAALAWSGPWVAPYPPGASFTVQRATNSTFTTGLSSTTVSASSRTLNQTVAPNTSYYYRIRVNNLAGSSAWLNATPFPVTTGP